MSQAEQIAYSRYLSRLESISRGCGDENEDECDELGSEWRSDQPIRLGAIHCRDPLAGEILRTRFNQALYQPNLLFHLRVLAESPPVAQLIGSVVAESVFEEGIYNVVVCQSGEAMFEEAAAWQRTMSVAPLSVHLH